MTDMKNDLTAPFLLDEVESGIKNKRILIIGSGADNDGRRMGDKIDGQYYDLVIRVNKHYGKKEDTGTRTDIIFTRWLQWVARGLSFFTDDDIQMAKKVIIINLNIGVSETEIELAKIEIGHERVSAGIIAVLWCINRGAAQIDLIGYGYHGGEFMKNKRYCINSFNYPDRMTDNNPLYDWEKELRWLRALPEINLL